MKTITLTRGLEVIVDDADYVALVGLKWFAVKSGTSHHVYAARQIPQPGGGQRQMLMHRLLLGDPTGRVRHINGNGLDNRRANLRVVSHQSEGAPTA